MKWISIVRNYRDISELKQRFILLQNKRFVSFSKKIRDFRQNALQIYFYFSCDRRIRTIPVIVSVTGFENSSLKRLHRVGKAVRVATSGNPLWKFSSIRSRSKKRKWKKIPQKADFSLPYFLARSELEGTFARYKYGERIFHSRWFET